MSFQFILLNHNHSILLVSYYIAYILDILIGGRKERGWGGGGGKEEEGN